MKSPYLELDGAAANSLSSSYPSQSLCGVFLVSVTMRVQISQQPQKVSLSGFFRPAQISYGAEQRSACPITAPIFVMDFAVYKRYFVC